jgi:hypothetical protein
LLFLAACRGSLAGSGSDSASSTTGTGGSGSASATSGSGSGSATSGGSTTTGAGTTDSSSGGSGGSAGSSSAGSGSGGSAGSTGGPGACAAALPLSGLGAPLVSASTAAQADDFASSCGGLGAGDTVYGWQAPADGWFVFHTEGSNFDTVLTVLDADCATELACSDDVSNDVMNPDTSSRVVLELTKDEQVYIVVDGDAMAGQYSLSVQPLVCPSEVLTPPVPLMFSDVADGAVDAHSNTCGGSGFPERGYAFTAASSGLYSFLVTPEGGKEVALSAYETASCGAADLRACTVTAPFSAVGIARYVDVGETVTFVVDPIADSSVSYDASLTTIGCPAETLTDSVSAHMFSLPGATPTLGGACGPAGYFGHTIGYSALSGGFYVFTVTGFTPDFKFYLLEGPGNCSGPESDCAVPVDQGGSFVASINRELNGGEQFTLVIEQTQAGQMVAQQLTLDVFFAVP